MSIQTRLIIAIVIHYEGETHKDAFNEIMERNGELKMKTIQNTIIGFTLTLAAAGMSFAAQAPAATTGSNAPAAPLAKKHAKKHTTKPAATTAPTATPTAPATK